jgi:hypothetical protein
MDLSSLLALPSTLTVDRVERSPQGLTVSLHATTSTVCCPTCGTAGSRVHSRYTRTVADLTCVGQRLILKLLVRKWICPLDGCYATLPITYVVDSKVEHFFTFTDFFEEPKTPDDHFSRPSSDPSEGGRGS